MWIICNMKDSLRVGPLEDLGSRNVAWHGDKKHEQSRKR
jgi:hypothetical protein